MHLSELNESSKFNVSDKGILVYLDPDNNTFRIVQDENTEQLARRGLTHTIQTKADYEKIAKKYNADINVEDWFKVSNAAKKENENTDFRRALAAMQKDIINMNKGK